MAWTELLTWYRPERQLPDSDDTLLCALAGDDEPVWPGFFDGDAWRSIHGGEFVGTVVAWARMPVGTGGLPLPPIDQQTGGDAQAAGQANSGA